MAISGNLATMPLPDLLQWLAYSQKTGILILSKGEIVKEIYFQKGKIVASSSNDPREYFGQFLLSFGKISENQLIEAFKKQAQSGVKIGRILVNEGFLEESEVQKYLRIKAEETIYDLFVWGDKGEFKFFNDATAEGNAVPIEMEVTSILMEGTRRSDEWSRIKKVFPSQNVIVKIIPENLNRDVLEDPVYNRVIQLLENPRRIADLCLAFHSSDFAVYKTLFDLYTFSIIEVELTEEVEQKEEEKIKDEEIRILSNQALKEYNSGEFEKAIQIFKHILSLEPNHSFARMMIQKSYDEIKDSLISSDFTIEHIPYLKRTITPLDEFNFTPQENYILSRINGINSVQSIIRISPILELQALMIFKKLAKDNLIGFLPPAPSTESK
jgi:tetratricopeptide (TPR) repeat protein